MWGISLKEGIKEFFVVLLALSIIGLPIAIIYINKELDEIEQV